MQVPPAWYLATLPMPNYINPELRGPAKIIVNVVLFFFVLLFVFLRIFTRLRITRSFGMDDWLLLVAMIPATVWFIMSILSDTLMFWNRHNIDVPFEHIVPGLKFVFSSFIIFAAAVTLTKLSMLVLIRRINTAPATHFWRWVTNIAIAIVSIQGTVFILTIIFQCHPVDLYWTISYTPQDCLDQTWSLLAAGIVNIFTDLAVVLLPLHTVWNVEIPRKQQFIIAGLFATGILSVAAGAVRTYYTYEVTRSYDNVWDSYPVWITSSVELYLGLICCSIPATRALFATYLPRLIGNSTLLRRTMAGGRGGESFGGGMAYGRDMTGTNVSIFGTQPANSAWKSGTRKGPTVGSLSDGNSLSEDLGAEEKAEFEMDRIQVTCKYEVTTT